MKRIIILLLVLITDCASQSISAQSIIKGIITDQGNIPVSFANIIINYANKDKVYYFGYSGNDGRFLIEIVDTGLYTISFSAMGYQTKKINILNDSIDKSIDVKIQLHSKPFILNEVNIKADKPVSIKKDTIVFNAKSFKDGNEEVVEDLLKKIPGVSVNEDGTITIGNKEIEKVMIEGTDFFDRGYKILTKNMPVAPIEKIEILKHFSNDRLLQGIEHSDKVALNLTLNTDVKNKWFGNIKAGYGKISENRYETKSNLMKFGRKNKYYFLTQLNNTGYDATGDINQLINPVHYEEPASIGDGQEAYSIIHLSTYKAPGFKRIRTNFNNQKIISLNSIITPTKTLKLKAMGFFSQDRNKFYRNNITKFSDGEINFTNNENSHLTNKPTVGYGKLLISYDISKNQLLEFTSKYNNYTTTGLSDRLFNNLSTTEKLYTSIPRIDHKISYKSKFNSSTILLLTARYIEAKSSQHYNITPVTIYDDYFATTFTHIEQNTNNKVHYSGFEAHLMNRRQNKNLIEIRLGNTYRKDIFISDLTQKKEKIITNNPLSFHNNINYSSDDIYIKLKYLLKLGRIFFFGKTEFHQLINRLLSDSLVQNQRPFFINPSLGFEWNLNADNRIYASFSRNITNASIQDIFNKNVIGGFRTFTIGTGTFNQLDATTWLLNYQLGKWTDNFFANTYIYFTKNHDFLSNNIFLNPNYSIQQKILVHDREAFIITSNIDRFIRIITSNIKFDIGFSSISSSNMINNSDLRKVKSQKFKYGMELRSGFGGFFNYHLGSIWTTGKIIKPIINEFTENHSFLDLIFTFKSFNLQVQSESYYFKNLTKGKNIFYFIDFEANYEIRKNKLSLSLSGKNLMNTSLYRNYLVDDISISTTEYRLFPSFFILGVKYRF
ncbi:MAG TPA: carboxypeptidase-like regulatory domain-containing protein [Bacteroidales bacterium]|nr:carboxypeptidase-like regulatory domain-containing protein [Bacteroidales bacterium]